MFSKVKSLFKSKAVEEVVVENKKVKTLKVDIFNDNIISYEINKQFEKLKTEGNYIMTGITDVKFTFKEDSISFMTFIPTVEHEEVIIHNESENIYGDLVIILSLYSENEITKSIELKFTDAYIDRYDNQIKVSKSNLVKTSIQ